jgi:hypothetical protein
MKCKLNVGGNRDSKLPADSIFLFDKYSLTSTVLRDKVKWTPVVSLQHTMQVLSEYRAEARWRKYKFVHNLWESVHVAAQRVGRHSKLVDTVPRSVQIPQFECCS